MKKIPLSRQGWVNNGKFALVSSEDYRWLSNYRWFYSAGGYCSGLVDGKVVLMHRLVNQTPDGMDTDHINGNKLDNRRSNLRSVNRTQNILNQPPRVNNKSGVTGVFWASHAGKWRAVLGKPRKGRSHHLGYFSSKQKAIEARNQAERELTGLA